MIIYSVAKQLLKKFQNLEEQFPHLITDIATVCFEAFHKINLDETLTLLLYEAHYSHVLRVEASNPASAFDIPDVKQRMRGIIMRIVTVHPQRHRLKFTGQHYALVVLRCFHDSSR